MFRAHLENLRVAAMQVPAAVSALAPHAGVVVNEARQLFTPAGARRALGVAEPFLVAAAERSGAGTPEVLAVLAGVKLVRHLLPEADPAQA